VTPKWVEGNKTLNPLSMRKKKKNNCRIFYDDERSSSFIGYDKDHPFLMTIEKGDILTMTVNMEEFHMTWFINEICV